LSLPAQVRAGEAAVAPAANPRLAIEPAGPGRLPWTVFDERAGLPQHIVVDLLQDPSGYVWAATQDGAARYDGRTWQTVRMPRQMGSNYPRVVRVSEDGGIWFGTFDGGLAHLQGDRWTTYDVR